MPTTEIKQDIKEERPNYCDSLPQNHQFWYGHDQFWFKHHQFWYMDGKVQIVTQWKVNPKVAESTRAALFKVQIST